MATKEKLDLYANLRKLEQAAKDAAEHNELAQAEYTKACEAGADNRHELLIAAILARDRADKAQRAFAKEERALKSKRQGRYEAVIWEIDESLVLDGKRERFRLSLKPEVDEKRLKRLQSGEFRRLLQYAGYSEALLDCWAVRLYIGSLGIDIYDDDAVVERARSTVFVAVAITNAHRRKYITSNKTFISATQKALDIGLTGAALAEELKKQRSIIDGAEQRRDRALRVSKHDIRLGVIDREQAERGEIGVAGF